ncbi:type I-E CRISPR-associated protein Cse1/CasA [Corynebacterium variabile]|uniref:type I-E CRISPR-associated protein Cse1/CasA n=1 Tax=Corynebacterium variabile TaxID=1727 RepID=UPI003FD35CED
MENHCNLLDRAWIDVIDHQGIESRVGVRALLRDASDYRALAAPLGTVNFAVLRMVEAILYRAWDSRKWRNLDNAIEHWQEKWDQETLFDDAVVGYLEQWQDRFDIWDAEHPFFQVAGLHTTRGEWKSLDILVPDVGDAGDLYTMRSGLDSVDAAEAAQMLVHCMAFDFSGIKSGVVGDARVKGGKGFPIGIGWCGWLGGTVVEGRNLRETLLLNYVPHREEAGAEDLPLWEIDGIGPGLRDDPRYRIEPPTENGATGQVELLTWPQRRLLLRWEEDTVTGVLISNGDPVGYTTKRGIETMTPWRFSEPKSKKAKLIRYMPQTLDAGRTMWRSLGGILPNSDVPKTTFKVDGTKVEVEKWIPAGNVHWVGHLVGADVIPDDRDLRIHMVSMEYGPQQSSFIGIVEDAITVQSPMLALDNDRLRATARRAVEYADGAAEALWKFAKNLAFAVSGNREEADTERIQAEFYTRVDTGFRTWLRNLGPDTDQDAALADWAGKTRSTATGLANDLLTAQGPAVWTGRWDGTRRVTGAVAADWLRKNLNDCLGKEPRRNTENGENA